MAENYDVCVIGGGPGGYVAAIRSAQLGLKTACIEGRSLLGGTCLNVGCIPSKTLLHASELYHAAHHQADFGISYGSIDLDFSKMMARKTEVLTTLGKGIDGLFRKAKITRIEGWAKLIDPTHIQVGDQQVEAKQIILATGSEPIPLPFLPFDEKRILSSTGALALSDVPKSMILVGAGVVGLELGSVYRRLGCDVTVVEFLDHICPSLDGAMSRALMKELQKLGMTFHLSSRVSAGRVEGNGVTLEVDTPEGKQSFSADVALVSIGRRPYSEGLGLDALGIAKDEKGYVLVDGHFRTKHPNIYAIGDLVNGPMLAHKASEEGVAVAEIIAGHAPCINYMAIPTVVYTQPEVAGVGFTEEQAKAAGLNVVTGSFPFKANSRARCTGEVDGLVKIVADANTDRLLGMHIMCSRAGDMIHEGVVALEAALTVRELGAMSHAHPTYAEAIKEAALAVHKEQIHL
jgi:dihydrolipoamide dehydrogenase